MGFNDRAASRVRQARPDTQGRLQRAGVRVDVQPQVLAPVSRSAQRIGCTGVEVVPAVATRRLVCGPPGRAWIIAASSGGLCGSRRRLTRRRLSRPIPSAHGFVDRRWADHSRTPSAAACRSVRVAISAGCVPGRGQASSEPIDAVSFDSRELGAGPHLPQPVAGQILSSVWAGPVRQSIVFDPAASVSAEDSAAGAVLAKYAGRWFQSVVFGSMMRR